MEIKNEVKCYQMDYVCDKCGKGLLRPIGAFNLIKEKPVYQHECKVCGHKELVNGVQYPYLVQEVTMKESK